MFKKLIVFSTVLLPVFSFAQQANGLKGMIQAVGGLVTMLIPITAGLALLYFFWGLAKFVRDAGSEDGREAGKEVMKWGIVALFVIATVWGIIEFVRGELQLDALNSIGPGNARPR